LEGIIFIIHLSIVEMMGRGDDGMKGKREECEIWNIGSNGL